MTVVAIIGILGAIATVAYQQYIARAKSADILVKYDALRTTTMVRLASGGIDDCEKLAKGLGSSNLDEANAKLSYGFEPVGAGGFRPVLNVCATSDGWPLGVRVAKAAYEGMLKAGNVEKNPVLTGSIVSFSLPLTPPNQAYCKTYTSPTAAKCEPPPGQSPTSPVPAKAPTTVAAPAAVTAPTSPAAQLNQQVDAALATPGMTAADLLNLIRTQAAATPEAAKTIGIPVDTPEAKAIAAQCGQMDTTINADSYGGDCKSEFVGMCNRCFVAQVCMKTCGYVGGITPEQKAALDRSMQVIEAWFKSHPGCNMYKGTDPACQ